MRVIVFNSQKGGSGKTTLCASLSVEAERAGHGPVFLIDTDPQGTLTAWHSRRQAATPQRLEVPFNGLDDSLALLRQRADGWCFLDTPPSVRPETTKLFALADLVLVPIRPSPSDLWSAAATVDHLTREQIPFLFVMNQVKATAAITAQAAAVLSEYGRVAPTFIGDRVACAAALTDGRTAAELAPSSLAAQEIAALWTALRTAAQKASPQPQSKGVSPWRKQQN